MSTVPVSWLNLNPTGLFCSVPSARFVAGDQAVGSPSTRSGQGRSQSWCLVSLAFAQRRRWSAKSSTNHLLALMPMSFTTTQVLAAAHEMATPATKPPGKTVTGLDHRPDIHVVTAPL